MRATRHHNEIKRINVLKSKAEKRKRPKDAVRRESERDACDRQAGRAEANLNLAMHDIKLS